MSFIIQPASGVSSLVQSNRTSNTPLDSLVKGYLINITSGTFTQTFDACLSLGSGWWCYIQNSGTGDITLDPNGSETIDGLTSYIMYPNEIRLVQCNGTSLKTMVVQPFYKTITTTGSFTFPPGYLNISGLAWSGGTGGQGGTGDAAATTRSSGAGGPGGGVYPFNISSFTAGSSITATIGAGSSGTAGGTGGNAGSTPSSAGSTSFGSYATVYGASSTTGGGNQTGFVFFNGSVQQVFGNQESTCTFSFFGAYQTNLLTTAGRVSGGSSEYGGSGGGKGGYGASSDNSSGSAPGGRSVFGATGGGGGGGVNSSNSAAAGQQGGAAGYATYWGNSGGGASGGSGAPGTNGSLLNSPFRSGGGGGGGGGNASGTGYAGGDGAAPGGGGGGGGAGLTTGGAGGNGARGEIRVWGCA